MNINVQQYNAVVEGLRTQLELQRQLTREKINIIASLTEQCNTLRQLRDGDSDRLRKSETTNTVLRTELTLAAWLANGDSIPPQFEWQNVPELQAIVTARESLFTRIDELESAVAERDDTIARCKARRGKKCCTKGCC